MPSFADQLLSVVKRTVAGEIGRAIGKKIGNIAEDFFSSSGSSSAPSSSHREAVDDIYQKMQARIAAQEKKDAELEPKPKPKRKPAIKKKKPKPKK